MDTGLLTARLILGLALSAHGVQKLFGWFGGYGFRGTGGFLDSLGFRPGALFALAAGLGELTLERAYYHCAACGQGFCPRDQALGLGEAFLSPAVTRMGGVVGAAVSFTESSALLQ